MKHMKVSPPIKNKHSSYWVKKKIAIRHVRKKKNFYLLKSPLLPPHHFSNGPPLSCRLLANEKADNEYNV